MPRKGRKKGSRATGCQGVFVELPLETLASFQQLARANSRSFKAELVHAMERHLATPPRVVMIADEPLPPVEGPAK